MTNVKDDFLILGFTGAFGSGSTSAAQFFHKQFDTKRKQYVAQKDTVNAEIADFYKKLSQAKKHNDTKEKKKELLKLVRKRQIINALTDVEPAQFYYISMTDMLNSLLVKECLAPLDETEQYSPDYAKLKDSVSKIAAQVGISPEQATKMRGAETERKSVTYDEFFGYYDKISKFRNEFHASYSDDFSKFIGIMQKVGNNLRKTGRPLTDTPFVSDRHLGILAHEAGTLLRNRRDWHKDTYRSDTRTYFLIECFRNPMEIAYFRQRYNEFFLFAIYTEEEDRHYRASEDNRLTLEQCQAIDKQDQGDDYAGEPWSQNVSQCVQLADIAVTNQKQPQNLYEDLLKYYALIKKPGCIKPTHVERNMNLAYSMSLNSTCICRQVGAVIVEDGYIVGAGWNDAERERLGCLYRLRGDIDRTNKDSFPICSEIDDARFRKIIRGTGENPDFSFCYKDEYAKLKDSPKSSLQQCRALHAEENAILQTSRIGGKGLREAAIYTTTFPCELCAKKILQVGINRVIYCEPYPRSVSKDVFFREGLSDIKIRPFAGVKSASFFRLFKPPLDVKDQQKLARIVQESVKEATVKREAKERPDG